MSCCRCCFKVSRETSLSRWSLEHLIETPEHKAAARSILGSHLNRYLVWARELEFYHILAIAARHARRKTMSGGTFIYFIYIYIYILFSSSQSFITRFN